MVSETDRLAAASLRFRANLGTGATGGGVTSRVVVVNMGVMPGGPLFWPIRR